jgi:hypothetical protein
MAATARCRLTIRCTGQRVRRGNLQPYGRVCGTEFTTTVPYRSRAAWIELARTAGWKVSPLTPGNTVTACCPACVTGARRKKEI